MADRPSTNGHAVEAGPQRAPLWSPFSASTPDPAAGAGDVATSENGDRSWSSPGASESAPLPSGAGPRGASLDAVPAPEAPRASPSVHGDSSARGVELGRASTNTPIARQDQAPSDPTALRMTRVARRERASGEDREPVRGPGAEMQTLSSARLLRPVKRAPRSGWRAALYAASGGLMNPGESPTDIARGELTDRVNQRLGGCYRIAALSLKGGVGKTSTTALLGSAFASLRGDRVIALDANPDRGNLAEKVPQETTATVRDLLDEAEHIRTAADVRAYTSQATSRLEVLASESDPEVSEAFNAADYHAAIDLLSRHYNILLTDCGTGLLHSALQAAVSVADSLLIVTSASIDGARSAQATVDWLEAHGHRDLLARSVTVINGVKSRPGPLDLDAVERFFSRHTREVVRVPFDRHLAEGAEIDLTQLSTRTRDAVLTLAAVVADDFARPSRHHGANARRTGMVLPAAPKAPKDAESEQDTKAG